MLGFKGNIKNFWSDELQSHQYINKTPFKGMRDHWHDNFHSDGYLLQSFNQDLPPMREKFYEAVGVKGGTVTWTCLIPNTILPPHTDRFYLLSQTTGVPQDQCVRYQIFLEDWKFGQYVELGDQSITKWKSGDVWFFDWNVLHYAVNASNYNFHSCQVSTNK